ncbi:MAG: hypothetical protein HQL53_11300 [Magnetococcales bacterium]|nr:hypothetical protein [Magnetococcales bacterium]
MEEVLRLADMVTGDPGEWSVWYDVYDADESWIMAFDLECENFGKVYRAACVVDKTRFNPANAGDHRTRKQAHLLFDQMEEAIKDDPTANRIDYLPAIMAAIDEVRRQFGVS